MVMKKIFLLLALSVFGFSEEPSPIALRQRQPNWKLEVSQTYAEGTQQIILFYEPTPEGNNIPAKQVFFDEQGAVQAEMDVIAAEDDASKIVLHGARVDLTPEGKLHKKSSYRLGVLHGPCQLFYPNGEIQAEMQYIDGQLEGIACSYFESGQMREEAPYVHGILEGELIRHHENGNKAMLIPHQAGKIHGTMMEWFPSGGLYTQRLFSNGLLHGDGTNPALIVYDEKRNVIEMLDFRWGEPFGIHGRY